MLSTHAHDVAASILRAWKVGQDLCSLLGSGAYQGSVPCPLNTPRLLEMRDAPLAPSFLFTNAARTRNNPTRERDTFVLKLHSPFPQLEHVF